jgi:hypothetical protein
LGFPFVPKRYGVDEHGRRALLGLTLQETFKFETLDDLSPLDETSTHIAWRDSVPITSREERWFYLYQKHDDVWKETLARGLSDL